LKDYWWGLLERNNMDAPNISEEEYFASLLINAKL
jgi:hypothetical protein